MLAQSAAALADPHPNLLGPVFGDGDDEDLRVWNFMIGGLDSPFRGGEFVIRLQAPPEFPMKPPSFEVLTPNGVYEPGGAICISIGEFHAKDAPGATGGNGWRPALGMKGFATEALNGLICHKELSSGIRIKIETPAAMAVHAKRSHAFNAGRFPALARAFERALAANPETAVAKAILAARV